MSDDRPKPITQERMEGAMEYLATSDEPFALEKMELEKAAILQKRVRSRIFLTSEGSVEQRKASGEVADDTVKADDHWIACLKAYETTKAKRQRAELVVEVWRSLNANRRQG